MAHLSLQNKGWRFIKACPWVQHLGKGGQETSGRRSLAAGQARWQFQAMLHLHRLALQGCPAWADQSLNVDFVGRVWPWARGRSWGTDSWRPNCQVHSLWPRQQALHWRGSWEAHHSIHTVCSPSHLAFILRSHSGYQLPKHTFYPSLSSHDPTIFRFCLTLGNRTESLCPSSLAGIMLYMEWSLQTWMPWPVGFWLLGKYSSVTCWNPLVRWIQLG